MNYFDISSVIARMRILCLILSLWKQNLLHHFFLYFKNSNGEKISAYIKIIKKLGVVSIFVALKLNFARRVVKDVFLSGCLLICTSVWHLLQMST